MYILRLVIAGVLSLISQLVYSESYTKLWGLASDFGKHDELLYAVEPQIRLVGSAGTYEQSLLNAGIGTTIKPQLQIWLGQTYTNYSDNNNVAEDVENVVINEYRVWEQIMWRRPFSDEFASRLRVEQRRGFESSEWAVRPGVPVAKDPPQQAPKPLKWPSSACSPVRFAEERDRPESPRFPIRSDPSFDATDVRNTGEAERWVPQRGVVEPEWFPAHCRRAGTQPRNCHLARTGASGPDKRRCGGGPRRHP